jgi:hypothetical protein
VSVAQVGPGTALDIGTVLNIQHGTEHFTEHFTEHGTEHRVGINSGSLRRPQKSCKRPSFAVLSPTHEWIDKHRPGFGRSARLSNKTHVPLSVDRRQGEAAWLHDTASRH